MTVIVYEQTAFGSETSIKSHTACSICQETISPVQSSYQQTGGFLMKHILR